MQWRCHRWSYCHFRWPLIFTIASVCVPKVKLRLKLEAKMCFFFFIAIEKIRRWFRTKKYQQDFGRLSVDYNEGNKLIQMDFCEEQHEPSSGVYNENIELLEINAFGEELNPILEDCDEDDELEQTDPFGYVTQKLVPYEEAAPEIRLPPIDYGDLTNHCTDL